MVKTFFSFSGDKLGGLDGCDVLRPRRPLLLELVVLCPSHCGKYNSTIGTCSLKQITLVNYPFLACLLIATLPSGLILTRETLADPSGALHGVPLEC